MQNVGILKIPVSGVRLPPQPPVHKTGAGSLFPRPFPHISLAYICDSRGRATSRKKLSSNLSRTLSISRSNPDRTRLRSHTQFPTSASFSALSQGLRHSCGNHQTSRQARNQTFHAPLGAFSACTRCSVRAFAYLPHLLTPFSQNTTALRRVSTISYGRRQVCTRIPSSTATSHPD